MSDEAWSDVRKARWNLPPDASEEDVERDRRETALVDAGWTPTEVENGANVWLAPGETRLGYAMLFEMAWRAYMRGLD